MAPGGLNHVVLDFEVFEQEIGRVGAVGQDAAHLGGRQHHHIGPVGAKPGVDRHRIEQIKAAALGRQQVGVAARPQGPDDGTARHAAVPRHKDAITGLD